MYQQIERGRFAVVAVLEDEHTKHDLVRWVEDVWCVAAVLKMQNSL
jgi:hypothetical protein